MCDVWGTGNSTTIKIIIFTINKPKSDITKLKRGDLEKSSLSLLHNM
jgi:hypothetical protein